MAVRKGPFVCCEKTGRIVGIDRHYRWIKWLLPLTGLAALVWYLVRVIPRPTRAAYPCQRVAGPIALSFVSYAAGLAGATLAFRKAKRSLAQYRYAVAGACAAAGVAAAFWVSAVPQHEAIAYVPPDPPNTPMGVARGIMPGRVAWAHNPNATSWDGSSNYWWSAANSDQTIVNDLVAKTICSVADKTNPTQAWAAIFTYYNQTHGRGSVGYTSGETIGIKINLNNSGGNDNNSDASPSAVCAVLDQLVNYAGVPQANINVFDVSRTSGMGNVQTYCAARFPNVKFNYHATWVDNAHVFSSTAITSANAKQVPQCAIDATYLIDLAVLKRHNQVAGITVCGKNWFGCCGDIGALHGTVAGAMGTYNPIVDLMACKYLGGKTLIWMIDGLYGAPSATQGPIKWNMIPFNNDWPSSMFASLDPVSIDSVALDLINAEMGVWTNSDNYLHEASQANAAPSGISYKPDGVTLTQGLGAHEHWNSSSSMKYSRNLGTGSGIELVRVDSSNLPPTLSGNTLYYAFDETSGSMAADSSGNGRNGTLVNGPTWAAGTAGNSVSLDGMNDYVDVPDGVVSGLSDFTVAAWVRVDSAAADSRIFDFGIGAGTCMYITANNSDGKLQFGITTSGVGGLQTVDATALPVGVWKHVAFVLSSGAGILYVDGCEVARKTGITLRPSDLGNTTDNYIGRSQSAGDPYFAGRIDEFQIYNRALTAADVGYLFGTRVGCIGAIKKLAPGTKVRLAGRVVTGSFSGSYGIQCPESGHPTCGIRVMSSNPQTQGALVNASGTLTKDANDELVIQEIGTYSPGGTTSLPKIYGSANKHIGGGTVGGLQGPDKGVSVNTVGVVQTTWGKATSVLPDASMLVDDGSGCPVKVYGPTGITGEGAIVRVTGVLSIEKSGVSSHIRVLFTRSMSDVRVMYGPTITLPSPLVYYAFNESTGTVAADSSGNGKNATLAAGASWAAGHIGNAVSLNGGTSGYVSMPSGIVSGLNNFTIAAWVKLSSLSTWSRIFDLGTGTTVNMFLTPQSGSGLRYAITTSGGGGEQQINGPALPTGVWKHVAVTLSGTTGIMYVGGVEVGRNTSMTLKPSSLGTTTANYIGKSQYSDPYLAGLVDDFRIYNAALSTPQISILAGQ